MSQYSPSPGYRPPQQGHCESVAIPQPNEGLGRALRDAYEPREDRAGQEMIRLLDLLR